MEKTNINTVEFDYNIAFKRNIGLMSGEELEKLKTFTIAIPGVGGVGSNHLMTLVRQGFQNFKIADFDEYELHNFNRQYGATMETINQDKATVMKKKALEVNPNCKIKIYNKGINNENIDDFLEGVDLAIDALDFFVVDIRRMFYNKCHAKKIPLITAGPMGFTFAGLIFLPEGQNFDEYFDIHDTTSYNEKLLHFGLGLSPSLLHRSYMKNVSLENKSGPSSIASVAICSGFVTTTALKILLQWGHIKAVPYYHQFDMMKNKYVCRRLLFGLHSPWQKLKLKIALKLMTRKQN